MRGPSNLEFFEFLSRELSFSLFRRSGESLCSFKETIEFVLVPEGTEKGPPEGLLYEGSAPLSYDAWRDFVAGFLLTSVESRDDAGIDVPRRVYHAGEGGRLDLLRLQRGDGESASANGLVDIAREELISACCRFVWTGPGREPGGQGQVAAQARQIACRGADSGMPAQLIFVEKLRLYHQRYPTH